FDEKVCGTCPSWTRSRCKETSDIFGDRPGTPESAELEYFRRFTRLVQRERWYADQDLADLLDDSRLELRVKNFRTICGAKIVPDAELFTFEFEKNTSDLERGDSVLIHAGRISSTSTFHGVVREIGTHRMRASIPLKNLDARMFEGQEWIIDRFPSDVTAEASHTALCDFLLAPRDQKKEAILGTRAKARDYVPGENVVAGFSPRSLNMSQIDAIERSVHCETFHLIWGPPGTGKTKVIPEIIRRIDGPVLLGAFTNTAVDKMLIALLEHDPSIRFLRVGRSFESPELVAKLRSDPSDFFTEDLALKYGTLGSVKDALATAK